MRIWHMGIYYNKTDGFNDTIVSKYDIFIDQKITKTKFIVKLMR